jgi:hypothetical protein
MSDMVECCEDLTEANHDDDHKAEDRGQEKYPQGRHGGASQRDDLEVAEGHADGACQAGEQGQA